ncbi:hypothetical protein CY35_19G071500 [Sphagnum magellanicum]|nr:hypothetical protein CY35_19G071500 [Sphagnum magellanicum]
MEQSSTIWWESTCREQFLPCFWLPYPYVWLASTWHPSLLPLENTLLIAAGAQAYGRCLLPSILGYAFMMPLIKFCQSQHIVFPLMCCTTAAFLLQFPMCFLHITKLKLDYQGGAMLTSILIILNTGILATFLRFSSKCKKSLKSFLIKALHDLTGFFKMALPSALMMCLEQWTFQILTLLVKLLPNTETEMAAFIIEDNVWGRAFSQVQEVLDCVSRTTSYLAVLELLDCCQTVLAGLVIGVGWQKWGMYANLGTHYGVGLPIAIILVLVFHFDGRGLWIGMLSGVAVQTIALTIISLSTNWENLDEWKTVVQGSFGPHIFITIQLTLYHSATS